MPPTTLWWRIIVVGEKLDGEHSGNQQKEGLTTLLLLECNCFPHCFYVRVDGASSTETHKRTNHRTIMCQHRRRENFGTALAAMPKLLVVDLRWGEPWLRYAGILRYNDYTIYHIIYGAISYVDWSGTPEGYTTLYNCKQKKWGAQNRARLNVLEQATTKYLYTSSKTLYTANIESSRAIQATCRRRW